MLVLRDQFEGVIEQLKKCGSFALDTETNGLYPYQGHRFFSIICATEHDSFYFNLNPYDDFCSEKVLDRDTIRRGFSDLLSDEKKLIFLANAKFDMHMLSVDGIEFKAKPWDVLSIDKTLKNTFMRYDLDSVAKRYGYEKDNAVAAYAKKHAVTYDKVPSDLMIPYGERDGEITYGIGAKQFYAVGSVTLDTMQKKEPNFLDLVQREIKTTQVCFKIEREGMNVDRDFIQRQMLLEQGRLDLSRRRFGEITGRELIDSNKNLSESFGNIGIRGGTTKLGNPSFNKQALKIIDHEVARTVENFRNANKRLSSYYQSFLTYTDEKGLIHPNIHQTGAKTFRLTVTNPALQTLEKPDEDGPEEALSDEMRNAFCARPGKFLVAIDYKQQEYCLTADYAGETELIKEIMKGEDVHRATAKLMGVQRQAAKTLNFMLLYGGGVAKLCMALMKPVCSELQLKGITKKYIYQTQFKSNNPKHMEQLAALQMVTAAQLAHDLPFLKEAHTLQLKYFSSLPKVKNFIDRVQKGAKERGYIYNWAGRRLYIPSPEHVYKMPNHLIQSSGAEIMRCALIELDEYLKDKETKILLSIYDEILFEMPESEFNLVPELQRIMKGVYKPLNGCEMDTDVKWGKSWGNLKKGLPSLEYIL